MRFSDYTTENQTAKAASDENQTVILMYFEVIDQQGYIFQKQICSYPNSFVLYVTKTGACKRFSIIHSYLKKPTVEKNVAAVRVTE
jgi:hypothetical protein